MRTVILSMLVLSFAAEVGGCQAETGAGADGIGAASFIYYGKSASELTLPEAAMMVSLLVDMT